MSKNGNGESGFKPQANWPKAVHEYELKDGDNIEEIELELRAKGGSYAIWEKGTMEGRLVPKRFGS